MYYSELPLLSIFFPSLPFPSLHLLKVKVNLDLDNVENKIIFLKWNIPDLTAF